MTLGSGAAGVDFSSGGLAFFSVASLTGGVSATLGASLITTCSLAAGGAGFGGSAGFMVAGFLKAGSFSGGVSGSGAFSGGASGVSGSGAGASSGSMAARSSAVTSGASASSVTGGAGVSAAAFFGAGGGPGLGRSPAEIMVTLMADGMAEIRGGRSKLTKSKPTRITWTSTDPTKDEVRIRGSTV